jgi:hypothetical protein
MLTKLIATGALGLIFLSATATVYIGSQLERSQCASLSLPLDYKITLGSGCKKQMAAGDLRFSVRAASQSENQEARRTAEDYQPVS